MSIHPERTPPAKIIIRNKQKDVKLWGPYSTKFPHLDATYGYISENKEYEENSEEDFDDFLDTKCYTGIYNEKEIPRVLRKAHVQPKDYAVENLPNDDIHEEY